MINLQIQVDERTLKAIGELAQCHTRGDVRKMASILLHEQVTPCEWEMCATISRELHENRNQEQKG